MEIPPGWHTTSLPPNPNLRQLVSLMQARGDEDEYKIMRTMGNQWSILHKVEFNPNEVEQLKAAAGSDIEANIQFSSQSTVKPESVIPDIKPSLRHTTYYPPRASYPMEDFKRRPLSIYMRLRRIKDALAALPARIMGKTSKKKS